MSVHALQEGIFSVGLDRRFIPISPDDPPARGALKLGISPFLILREGRVILIDAGLGEFSEGGTVQTMRDHLERFGLNEYHVTDIVLSHLHYDHIGGLAHRENGWWELTYPDAAVWVNRREYEKTLAADRFYDEEKTQFLHFLAGRADFRPVDEGPLPVPGFHSRHIGGHTEFSVAWLYHDLPGEAAEADAPSGTAGTDPASDPKGRTYLMAGDVIGSRGAVRRKYAAKYDFDPDAGMAAREALKAEALQYGWNILAYHDSECPVFRLTGFDAREGYLIENLTETVAL